MTKHAGEHHVHAEAILSNTLGITRGGKNPHTETYLLGQMFLTLAFAVHLNRITPNLTKSELPGNQMWTLALAIKFPDWKSQ